MQAKLDELRNRFYVPRAISMRAPMMGEVPQQAHKELGEIAFLIVALECGVRLPLAPFIGRLLSDFSLHPLLVSPTLWEQCLALCVLWHKLHSRDPSCKELQSYFGVRQRSAKSSVYFPHNSVGQMIKGTTIIRNWTHMRFFLGASWELLTYGAAQVEGHVP